MYRNILVAGFALSLWLVGVTAACACTTGAVESVGTAQRALFVDCLNKRGPAARECERAYTSFLLANVDRPRAGGGLIK